MQEKISEEETKLESIISNRENVEQIEAHADAVSVMGKYIDGGNIVVTEKQHMILTSLARDGLYSRETIKDLQAEVAGLKEQIILLKSRIKELLKETRAYHIASRLVPEKVKAFLSGIIERGGEDAERLTAIFDFRVGNGLDIVDRPESKAPNMEQPEQER
jgi:hypothetical protein